VVRDRSELVRQIDDGQICRTVHADPDVVRRDRATRADELARVLLEPAAIRVRGAEHVEHDGDRTRRSLAHRTADGDVREPDARDVLVRDVVDVLVSPRVDEPQDAGVDARPELGGVLERTSDVPDAQPHEIVVARREVWSREVLRVRAGREERREQVVLAKSDSGCHR